jgi:ZIP family zinc transporter
VDALVHVIVYSTLAAATAALGPIPLSSPFASPERPPLRLLAWATALAAGIMLGVAYALMTAALDRDGARSGLGALAGIACLAAARAVTAPGRILRLGALHAIPEGIAIGVAMTVGLPFGALTAVALGVHNIPESTIVIAALIGRGASLPRATALAVAANINQVVFAAIAFLAVWIAPVLLPWTLGFAVGALLFLCVAELLPESYRGAGRTSIAVVVIIAVGIVVLLHERAR